MGMFFTLLNMKSDLSVRKGVLCISNSSTPWLIMRAWREDPQPATMLGGYICDNQSFFALLLVPAGR